MTVNRELIQLLKAKARCIRATRSTSNRTHARRKFLKLNYGIDISVTYQTQTNEHEFYESTGAFNNIYQLTTDNNVCAIVVAVDSN